MPFKSIMNSVRIDSFPSFGVCMFLLLFWIPDDYNVSIFLLATIGFLSFFYRISENSKEVYIIVGLLLSLAAVTVISICFSKQTLRSIFTSLPLESAFLIFFLIVFFYRNIQDIIITYGTLFVVSLLISLSLLYTVLTHYDMAPLEWAKVTFSTIIVVPNDISIICLTAPLGLSLCYYYNKPSLFTLFFLYIVLIIITVSVYKSAVGIICLVAAITSFALVSRKYYLLWLPLLTVSLCFLIDSYINNSLTTKLIQTIQSYGWDPRVALWLAALKMFFAAPLLGSGPHTYVYYYRDYINSLDLPSWLILDNRLVPWPHNLYLEMLAERGFLAFLVFILLIGLIFFYGKTAVRTCVGKERFLLIGSLSAMVGFALGSFVECTFYVSGSLFFFFTVTGLIAKNIFRINLQYYGDDKCLKYLIHPSEFLSYPCLLVWLQPAGSLFMDQNP